MTLLQASEKYNVDFEKLKAYEQKELIAGKCNNDDEKEYSEDEIKKCAIINLLLEAGLSYDEIHLYLTKSKTSADNAQKVKILKKHRNAVLDGIHDGQRLLQNLNYLIFQTEKATKN